MSDYRLCTRLDDAFAGRAPGSAVDHCVRCQEEIWVDAGPGVPPEEAALEPVCTRCVVADPELAAGASPKLMEDMLALHYWADRFRAARN